MIVVRVEAIAGEATARADAAQLRSRYEEIPVGGFIFFEQDIGSRAQTRDLADSLRALSDVPMWIGVDMEGGVVNRFPEGTFPYLSPALAMAKENTPDGVHDIYERMGIDLTAWGFNLDFAPVADVFSNPQNEIIGDRAFGTTPQAASPYVAAAARGLLDAGVQPVLKHFPGHGDTSADTHKGAVIAGKTLKEMESFEFLPFRAGLQAGANAVMAAHVICPKVTDDGLPASLSRDILTGVLREKLGFDGVVFTDALDMGAITKYYTSDKAAVQAILAGADVLLMPDDCDLAYEGVLAAVQDGTISEELIDQSVRRIRKAKESIR